MMITHERNSYLKTTQLRQEEERAPDDISQPTTRQVPYMWKKIEVQGDPEA